MSEKLTVKCTDVVDVETGKVIRTTKQTFIPDDDQRLDIDTARVEKLGRLELRRVKKEQDQ